MLKISFKLNKISYLYFRLFQQLAEVKKQTAFFLQTADFWSTSSAADVCKYDSQTADVLPLKKQTTVFFLSLTYIKGELLVI
ncbi:hypothetical protein Hanom_Chr08g00753571 [Helianthus anomalus]